MRIQQHTVSQITSRTVQTLSSFHVLHTVTDMTNLIKKLGVFLDSKHTHNFYINISTCKAINGFGLPSVFLLQQTLQAIKFVSGLASFEGTVF